MNALTFTPIPWLAALVAVAVIIAVRHDRRSTRASRQLSAGAGRSACDPLTAASSHGVVWHASHGATVTITSSTPTAASLDGQQLAAIERWALEDGHRRPGIDETRARADTRPHGGLCEVVPLDELRRQRAARTTGGAA